MVLAIGSLLAHASQRLRIRPAMQAMVCPLLLACLCGATLLRAHDWRSKLDIARVATEGAPASGRAWTQLCASRFDAGGGAIPGNPLLDERSEEHTSELQSLMRISYAVFCLKKKQ